MRLRNRHAALAGSAGPEPGLTLALARSEAVRRAWTRTRREAAEAGADEVVVHVRAPASGEALRAALADAVQRAVDRPSERLTILVEEAQALSPAGLGMLGRLAPRGPLSERLRVVLIGPPELAGRVAASVAVATSVLWLEGGEPRSWLQPALLAGLLSAAGLIALGGAALYGDWRETPAPAAVPAASPAPAGSVPEGAETPPPKQDASVAPPSSAAAPTAGLLLQARSGDTVESLYARVYRGLNGPPLAEVAAMNPNPVKPGDVLVFPAPPGGWAGSARSGGR